MSHKNAPKKGFVLWFTGLPCSGKTTLSGIVAEELLLKGCGVKQFDGDILRVGVSRDLKYSKADRKQQVYRVTDMVSDFIHNGSVALVSLISPYRDHRNYARKKISSFIEMYVRCPLYVCESRDIKGMYRLAREGKIRYFTGVSAPYEEPRNPEIIVDTDKINSQSCAGEILDFLRHKGYLSDHPLPEKVLEI